MSTWPPTNPVGFVPKPAKGTHWIERKARRRAIDTSERNEKAKVRKRDGRKCRWPNCEYKAERARLEVAHLKNKGIGGDHGKFSTADQMIHLCYLCHQGAKSLHSGDRKIRPLTKEGTNGPCLFMVRERGSNKPWTSIAEIRPGVSEIPPND